MSTPRTSQTPDDAVGLLDEIVRRALIKGASDIHLEPKRERTIVRLRIDGAMLEDSALTPDVALQVVSRVKVLARMDIAERRIPQDGQLTVDTGPMRACTCAPRASPASSARRSSSACCSAKS